MSLGPLMVDIAGAELTPDDTRVLAHPLIGGVLLFTRNYRNPKQLSALTAAIRALRTPALLVAVDHEGGRVQRFRDGFTKLPPLRALGRRYDQDRRQALALAHSAGWLMASEVRAVGIDFSFAPCVDLDYGVSEIIGDRAFGGDAETVSALALAYTAGMREAGMAATAKHFPGHGAVVADSHVALPIDRRSYADLEADLRPYRRLIENRLSAVMAAHVVFPQADSLPASLSHYWIGEVLRGQFGFHGCVFADDLSMAGAAAFGDVLARARMALAAGCDVVPICNDRGAVQQVLDHFKPEAMNPASQARIVRMRARGGLPPSDRALADLAQTRAWGDAVAAMADLTAPPPLVLTEAKP